MYKMQKVYLENIGGIETKTTIYCVMNETIKLIDDF